MSGLSYNFRLGPEAVWLIVNTVLGTILVEVTAAVAGWTVFPGWDDLRTWGVALALSAIRTALGALLAAVTGGFQLPGVAGPPPANDRG